jgi:hypothetical protein
VSWWEQDPRYGKAGWTLIHPADGGRPYFVQARPRKRRASPRALRFADVQAGAVLIGKVGWHEQVKHPLPVANDDLRRVEHEFFAVVTDRWFDPCAGEDDRLKGEMVAVKQVNAQGLPGGKRPHTLRGLASQGYRYATPDQARAVHEFVAERAELMEAWKAGRLTEQEVRLRARPYRELMRLLPPRPAAKSD